MQNPWTKGLHKSIGIGFLWLTILFVIDTVDSVYLLSKTTTRIKAEAYITDLLVQAVGEYVAEILFGYLFIGLLAGILIHLFLRLWFPETPSRKKSIQTWFCFGLSVSLWWYLRSIVVQPSLHTYLTNNLPAISDAFDAFPTNVASRQASITSALTAAQAALTAEQFALIQEELND